MSGYLGDNANRVALSDAAGYAYGAVRLPPRLRRTPRRGFDTLEQARTHMLQGSPTLAAELLGIPQDKLSGLYPFAL